MKIIKTLAVAGVATMLFAGSAFAWNESDNNCNLDNAKLRIMNNKDLRVNGNINRIRDYRISNLDVISEITGKSVDEIKELCTSLNEEGKTLVDYLTEQNLLDDVKSAMIDKAEEGLNKLVEEGRITQEKLEEKLEQITLKINDEEFKLIGGVFNKYRSGNSNINSDLLELTGLDRDEFRDLCTELKEDGKTMVDYLKDQGLYDEWKSIVLDKFEEKIINGIENNRITEEKATQLREQLEQKLEEGKLINMGNKNHLNKTINGLGQNQDMLELTGLTADEFKDLCTELRDEGKTITDYLKEQGLFEEWKQGMLDRFEDRINTAVENGKLTADKTDELLTQYEENLENGLKGGMPLKFNADQKVGFGKFNYQRKGNKNA